MATKRELVEAHAFSRRRLVTAFVSGAPGGREVEPARPGRTIIGGLALAVLLVAGAAIAGILAPRTPDDWTQPGLIVAKENGATYVIIEESEDPELRPVINITSAQLILAGEAEPRIVSQEAIDEQTIGDDIGILGAPVSPPGSSQLIDTGWTACTDTGRGLRVDVSADPGVEAAPDSGFVVESEGRHYVIATARQVADEAPRAHAYLLPASGARSRQDNQDNLLRALRLPVRDDATRVPAEWVSLFPAGGSLDFETFGITGLGDPVEGAGDSATGIPAEARVGDYFPVGDDEALVLTEDGPMALDPFAYAVYLNIDSPGASDPEDLGDVAPSVPQRGPTYDAARWPGQLLQTVPGEHCAQLEPVAGEQPGVRLATSPSEDASSGGLSAERKEISVDAGRGAYVLSGGWDDEVSGAPYVIDAKGRSYPLVGDSVADRLGYADYDAPVVPDAWVELFDEGVALSVDSALCPPGRVEGRSCE